VEIILEQLIQLNGSFVVEVVHQQIQYLLIQFVLNYLRLSCCFKKVVHVKLLTEEILFKLDGCSNVLFFSFLFHFTCFSLIDFRWDDENSNESVPIVKNNASGTIPDHDFKNDNTLYFYCTYGPSFRNQFISFLLFHFHYFDSLQLK